MSIDNTADTIDSREIIERIEELRTVRDDSDSPALDEDEVKELASLEALAAEGADYAPDWEYGETLINDSYFEDYARELAYDIGAVNEDAGWPNGFIDWERAAEALQMDYTAIEFDGVTFWVR